MIDIKENLITIFSFLLITFLYYFSEWLPIKRSGEQKESERRMCVCVLRRAACDCMSFPRHYLMIFYNTKTAVCMKVGVHYNCH